MMTRKTISFDDAERMMRSAKRLSQDNLLFGALVEYRGIEYVTVDLRAEGDDVELVILNPRTRLLVDAVPRSAVKERKK